MNTSTTATVPASPSLTLEKVDRVGVAASVLCAIHCAIAPILLIALPTFGKIWAHPASHILVALFVVPIAAFSIRRGYQTHGRRWVAVMATIGILFVLIGAALPAFSKGIDKSESAAVGAGTGSEGDGPVNASAIGGKSDCAQGDCAEGDCAQGDCAEGDCAEGDCAKGDCAEGACESTVEEGAAAQEGGCVDNCCPSLQVDESGKTSLHIPPAAIVTTIGGLFLITAHVGNLCACGHACRMSKCESCT
jgi:hypothetical protein